MAGDERGAGSRRPTLVAGDVWVLQSLQPAPGHGVLPVNAFIVGADPPLLIDTGLSSMRDQVLGAVRELVDPAALAAVFLTHDDPDHAGNVVAVLEAAANATLVTGFVSLGRLLESCTVPLDRVHVVDAGDVLPGSDERMLVLRPPVFDSPGTLGLHDRRTGALFTVDAFGSYLPAPTQQPAVEEIRRGVVSFNRVNHPWMALVERARIIAALDAVAALQPSVLLSSHGVVAPEATAAVLEALADPAAAVPYQPPSQAEFEALRPQYVS